MSLICHNCDTSLTAGQRYITREENIFCARCFEDVLANSCDECSKPIGIDSKDVSHNEKHWHGHCFLCSVCRISLVGKTFESKIEKLFCSNCYTQAFATRCVRCGQVFTAGMKKMEYKGKPWHDHCFVCASCKNPIGTRSFVPRNEDIYCTACYEDKFAARCTRCRKTIASGGVTYKNEPWHRECFCCSNCRRSLAGQSFSTKDERPYCDGCFGELFAKKCAACKRPITGPGSTTFVTFEDRQWHNECFRCARCRTTLVGKGFNTDAANIVCLSCFKYRPMSS